MLREWWRARRRMHALGLLERFVEVHPCADAMDAAVLRAAREVVDMMVLRAEVELKRAGG